MKKFDQKLFKKLERIVGTKNISSSKDILDKYSKDWSFHPPSLADVIVWPESTSHVSKILKFANANTIFIVPWGGGSSLEGNPIPVKGGIVLDMTRMNKVLKVLKHDLQVKAQPGIIGDKLNDQLAKDDLFFPAAPGSSHIATIGGMIANNAGGMFSVKYGVVGDWVLELEVVLADGRIVRVGRRSVKSVSGYDLRRLFIGSEGTLCVITEVVLRLTSLPESKMAVMASFEKVNDAVNATLDMLKSDVEPAALEFMDEIYMQYVNIAKSSRLPEKPTLIVEFHGDPKTFEIKQKKLNKILGINKAFSVKKFSSPEKLKLLWSYRRAVRPLLGKIFPGMGVLSAECGVPISEVAGFLKKASALSKRYGLKTIMFGHIGDGNFHGWALYEQNNDSSWKKVTILNEELIKYAISVGGTTTGEHGVGIGKRKFMNIEHPTSLSIMRDVKKMFDPNGILNPGKMFLD